MKITLGKIVLIALNFFIILCHPVWAVATLQEVKINPTETELQHIEFSFSEPITGVTENLIYNPNRLSIYIPDAVGTLKNNPMQINRHGIDIIKIESDRLGVNIIIGLEELLPYQVKVLKNKLLLYFGGTSLRKEVQDGYLLNTTAGEKKPTQSKFLTDSTEPKQNVINQTKSALKMKDASSSINMNKPEESTRYFNSVMGIDFRRGKEGQGEFIITLDNKSAVVDVSSRGQLVLVKFHGTKIPEELLNLVNVQDFATPVSQIEVSRQGIDTMFELRVSGRFDYRYDQTDKLFILEIKKQVSISDVQKYKGKPISLNFQDIPVRTVLQLIADFNSLNLVTTDSVVGNITLRLDGVPWEQALDIILKVRGLDKRLDNNILLIAPAEEIAIREKQQLENRNQVAELAPLSIEYLQINYAKAAEVAALLSSESTKLLSPRGAVSVDERTNVLVVKDTADVIISIKRMLDILDIPVKQVVIEARMVTIDDGFDEALGVRWGVTKNDGHGNSTSGSIEGNDGSGNNNGGSAITRPGVEDRLNVNLPVTNAAGTLAFQVARLADGTLLDLELSALEKESKAEIIASPRVTTANQKPALIEQGTEIPYVESSSSGATSVTFKKAVLSLKVTPQITPDNRVILDLTVTQDTKGETVPTGTGDAVSINAQSITTQVLVNNGETLVLGGIYQQTIKSDVSKVPLLGDIPGLGVLFRKTTSENKKRELLIFVTPKIVSNSF
ncbi:type IV pilus secretin PilQ [Aeromonas cavernicola]|uniref:Pilus assembly protein PilQ n=1 Tax=Aeromonas cavernicola TaxID=1006623 RepID=A0A2H9U9M8_9GAMM|nr:type IV pilus secretin PilQ family protein [Aeromonas cavernicola]PJG60722.1 pilus assembly protein PilQ [Aeromonas cavernicola]